MPTVHRERGFQFFIYPNDHQPAHIHVFHSDGEIKIDISSKEPIALVVYGSINQKTVNKALDIAEDNLHKLQTEWEKFHGSIK